MSSGHSFTRILNEWTSLAEEDPHWAILSIPGKEGGKWTPDEFFETGQDHVNLYLEHMARFGLPQHFERVLDFGCGVGRLSQAWLEHADHVTGVDIAEPMIQRGKELSSQHANLELIHNPHEDLRLFADNHFDLVFTHICLQHMPFSVATAYIREFARICAPGGHLVFQLPEAARKSQTSARMRRWIIDYLPFGLGKRYRKWKYGRTVLFNMHFTPRQQVLKLTQSCLLDCIAIVDPVEAGELEGALYFMQKPAVRIH